MPKIKTKEVDIKLVLEYENDEQIIQQWYLGLQKLLELVNETNHEVLIEKENPKMRVRIIHENT